MALPPRRVRPLLPALALALGGAAAVAGCEDDGGDVAVLCRTVEDCFPEDFAEVYPSVKACVDELEAAQAAADARFEGCGDAQRRYVRCASRLGCGPLADWIDGREMAACEAETMAAEYVCNTPPEQRDAGAPVPAGDAGVP